MNGPAFPTPDVYTANGDAVQQGSPGMSLRDYFAAAAMQGLVLKYSQRNRRYGNVARMAYSLADAMLKERAK
jgi:hypothetical protein